MKAELIPTFAHDLRASLRAIMVATQRAQRQRGELSEETRTRLDEIVAAARRQEDLIAAFVEYDQASLAGDSPLDLGLVIQNAAMKIDSFRQCCNGLITVNSGVPKVRVPSGLSRVIEKVLHNGLKFQPAGGQPVVHVKTAQPAGDVIAIVIEDNGIGIEPAYREVILEPFKRLHSSADYPGNGLGLATCRRLLDSIGGTLCIDDAGVTITVAIAAN